jgi:hypothetical protein
VELILPEELVAALAHRRRRLHLYTWHRLRHSWLRLGDRERRGVEEIDPSWVPPRAALDPRGHPIHDNDSGVDFLHMNRRLMEWVNRTLAAAGGDTARVAGWRRTPPPGDPDYPVPAFSDSGLERLKSDGYYERHLTAWERRFTDADYLRRVSLGRLGSEIEFTICNDMHLRWAAPSPVGYRPSTAFAKNIDPRWDDPAYNYLGDLYASHVNPLFWKLRGWVDDRVEDWKLARGVVGDIEWEGAWAGPECGDDGEAAVEAMERIDRVISGSAAGTADGYLRPDPTRL